MLLATDTVGVGGREEWSDATGSVLIVRPALRVATFRVRGFYSDELEYFARSRNGAMLDELVARGDAPRFHVFCDWAEMTGYTPGARTQATGFILTRRKQFALACILFRSPLVAMGIKVGNMLLGGFLQATTTREEFDDRLAASLEVARTP